MGKASNEAKQRWNSDHYTQIKVSVKPEIAASFKANCLARNVSMASALTRFMLEKTDQPYLSPQSSVASRPLRRKEIKNILELLAHIIDAETQYMDNIPLNLKNSRIFDAAEQSLSALQDAFDLLANAY